jgi:hypothetical protein
MEYYKEENILFIIKKKIKLRRKINKLFRIYLLIKYDRDLKLLKNIIV